MSTNRSFFWTVSRSGYQWVTRDQVERVGYQYEDVYSAPKRDLHVQMSADQVSREEQTFLTDGVGLTELGTARHVYEPLSDYPMLFRTFANTDTTADAILGFAQQYGFLGSPIDFELTIAAPGALAITSGAQVSAEPFSAWVTEILSMRSVLKLWDAARTRDDSLLSNLVKWTSQDEVILDRSGLIAEARDLIWPDDIHEVIASRSREVRPELLARFRRYDVIEPALFMVGQLASRMWSPLVKPRLSWSSNADPESPLETAYQPESLLGALWEQAAKAFREGKDHRRCDECGTWFEYRSGTRGYNKLYCSRACQVRAYRHRRESGVIDP